MANSSSSGTTARNNEEHRICIDRVIPDEYHPARAAAEQAAAEIAQSLPTPATLGDIDPTGVLPATLMALVNAKMWPKGSTLKCRFLDGDATQRKKVEAKAHLWEQYANIKLSFVATGDAQIRISFSADPGSWSAIGTDALVERYFPKYQPTMNYGWLRDDTDDQEYERVVVHEFGHALGCIHEHQSPVEELKWKKTAVYRYFSGPPNYWTKEQIDFNILQKYTRRGMSFTPFDPDSIMLYQFPGALFTDGKPTKMNVQLSALDKQMIARMYPKG